MPQPVSPPTTTTNNTAGKIRKIEKGLNEERNGFAAFMPTVYPKIMPDSCAMRYTFPF
jgi:hypothetical protein